MPSEKEERTAPNRDDLLDSAASTHAAHVAGPTSINPAGRDGGARVSNVRSDAGGVQSTPERCGAAARYDSDDGTKGEEGEENEDVQASSFYTVPDTASARIKEVIGIHTCMHVGHTHGGPTRAVNRRFISMPCIALGPFSPLSQNNGQKMAL